MSTSDIRRMEDEIAALKKRLAEARRKAPREPVGAYTFTDGDGAAVSLESLFGGTRDLIVVHNMGKRCPYCTLWADGFNGVAAHLQSRAAFVLTSPDDPETMRRFAAGRGWTFRVVSTQGTTFAKDMGYESDEGGAMPGVSAFHRDGDGRIVRTGTTTFGPGDDFCGVWPMFDLLAEGRKGWAPRYAY